MDLAALVLQCTPANVSAYTMHQIMSVESAHSPYTIGFKLIRKSQIVEQGRSRTVREVSTLTTRPQNTAAAIEWARFLTSQGWEFDAGAAQIHSTNFASYGLTLETVFEPCTNIRVGARILEDCYARALVRFRKESEALTAAISCYQTGNFGTGSDITDYVQKVISAKVPPTISFKP
jgi:type IV secretion system protein VirB1